MFLPKPLEGDKAAVHQRQSDETSFCRFKFDGKRFGPLNMQHLHTHNTLWRPWNTMVET